MYQFSRSIYRELAPYLLADRRRGSSANRLALLRACEGNMERLASDPHYFAHPARSLFSDVRVLFPMEEQLRVLRVIERHMALAQVFVERYAESGVLLDGSPMSCNATTRRGTPCQRDPLPGTQYCPSHKHLAETLEVLAA